MIEKSVGLRLIANNALPISLQADKVLVEHDGQAALGLVDYGQPGGRSRFCAIWGSLNLYGSRRDGRDNLALFAQFGPLCTRAVMSGLRLGLPEPICSKRFNPGLPSG